LFALESAVFMKNKLFQLDPNEPARVSAVAQKALEKMEERAHILVNAYYLYSVSKNLLIKNTN
jgi:hypothetical protein